MSEKIGGNDPCPCDSGKKYKHCCLRTKPVSIDGIRERERDASDQLTRAMIRYVSDNFADFTLDAWEDFHLGEVSRRFSWTADILGSIGISERSLVAEVNSESRATRVRAEFEKRLGASATHQSTAVHTVEEMLAESKKREQRSSKVNEETDDAFLSDPEVRKHFREHVQKQVEAWTREKIPVLGGRTPMQAVRDPDGREIVEALLLDGERSAEEGIYQPDIRPDFNAVRKLLNLGPTS